MPNVCVCQCVCVSERERERESPGEEAGNFPTGDFLLVAFLILQQ